MPSAPTRLCSATCEARARMSVGAGRWICCWGRLEARAALGAAQQKTPSPCLGSACETLIAVHPWQQGGSRLRVLARQRVGLDQITKRLAGLSALLAFHRLQSLGHVGVAGLQVLLAVQRLDHRLAVVVPVLLRVAEVADVALRLAGLSGQ